MATKQQRVQCPGCGAMVREDKLSMNPKVAKRPVCPECARYVIR